MNSIAGRSATAKGGMAGAGTRDTFGAPELHRFSEPDAQAREFLHRWGRGLPRWRFGLGPESAA